MKKKGMPTAIYQFRYDNGTFVKEHDGLRQASRETGVSLSDISACCKGKHKHAGGFIWVLKSDYE